MFIMIFYLLIVGCSDILDIYRTDGRETDTIYIALSDISCIGSYSKIFLLTEFRETDSNHEFFQIFDGRLGTNYNTCAYCFEALTQEEVENYKYFLNMKHATSDVNAPRNLMNIFNNNKLIMKAYFPKNNTKKTSLYIGALHVFQDQSSMYYSISAKLQWYGHNFYDKIVWLDNHRYTSNIRADYIPTQYRENFFRMGKYIHFQNFIKNRQMNEYESKSIFLKITKQSPRSNLCGNQSSKLTKDSKSKNIFKSIFTSNRN
ncbi:putative SP-containing protein [Vairimorpha necatrix]|uniref:SP-containing protein n=1 Tax=Vairimorpha necatrix TaxID=6039 RepID=A0AAX4JEB5_9MICR